MSQIEKFIGGEGNFGNLWVTEETPHGPLSVIPEKLHCQSGKVFAANKNITAHALAKAHISKHGFVSDWTIQDKAVLAICEAKKMLSLVDGAAKKWSNAAPSRIISPKKVRRT